MKNLIKPLCLLMTFIMVMSMLAGCGSSKSTSGLKAASDDTTFTWWIYQGADSSYYMEYSDNPALKYSQLKGYGSEDKGLSFEFWVPAAGTAADNYATMIASGDLPDLIDAILNDPPEVMYKNGQILDITEYVERNMPNYVALVHSDPVFYANCITMIDGEEHYLVLRGLEDEPGDIFQGYMYRRDWLVKYGTNPVTGASFTGGPTGDGDDDWADDVVFPSGNTDPMTISDWEWMFGVFDIAMADQGITDSYVLSLYYPGFTWNGGLLSSFGGGTCVWYQDKNRQVHFGGDSEQMRAYLECMNNWYAKGWLDAAFNERTSDSFYGIDTTAVRQGRVPVFNGTQSQLGKRMDSGDELTSGIFVAAAPYPINDIYGTAACKGVQPDSMMGASTVGGGVLITKAAEGKDLDTLCAYFDTFYAQEGALMRTLGLSAEQAAEYEKKTGETFYTDNGLSGGAYTVENGKFVKTDMLVNDNGNLGFACCFQKVPGLMLRKNVDLGYPELYTHYLNLWKMYPNTANFTGTITTNSMPEEDSKICDSTRTKVLEYMTNNAVLFIKGEKDIQSDDDWNIWVKSLNKYNIDKITNIYQGYVDLYPFC